MSVYLRDYKLGKQQIHMSSIFTQISYDNGQELFLIEYNSLSFSLSLFLSLKKSLCSNFLLYFYIPNTTSEFYKSE